MRNEYKGNIYKTGSVKTNKASLIIYSLLFLISVLLINSVYIVNKLNIIKEAGRKTDSLYLDLYYSIIDTFEKESFIVTVTTYNPVKEQTNNDPRHTACMLEIDLTNPYKHRYIALSRDLLEDFYYGEKVMLENAGKYSGTYIVADCMNKRHTRRVDILIGNKQLHTLKKNVVLKHIKSD